MRKEVDMGVSRIDTGTTPAAVEQHAAPEVGERVPELFVDTRRDRVSVRDLAGREGTLVLVSIDSYRYHPG